MTLIGLEHLAFPSCCIAHCLLMMPAFPSSGVQQWQSKSAWSKRVQRSYHMWIEVDGVDWSTSVPSTAMRKFEWQMVPYLAFVWGDARVGKASLWLMKSNITYLTLPTLLIIHTYLIFDRFMSHILRRVRVLIITRVGIAARRIAEKFTASQRERLDMMQCF